MKNEIAYEKAIKIGVAIDPNNNNLVFLPEIAGEKFDLRKVPHNKLALYFYTMGILKGREQKQKEIIATLGLEFCKEENDNMLFKELTKSKEEQYKYEYH